MNSWLTALGKDELKKFQAEIEAMTKTKLKKQFAKTYQILEAEKRLAVKNNSKEIHAQYEEYLKSAQQELEEKLQVNFTNFLLA